MTHNSFITLQRTIEIKETTSLTMPVRPHMERNCFRIRSKLSTYCVDKSLRSDWSDKVCYPGTNVSPSLFIPVCSSMIYNIVETFVCWRWPAFTLKLISFLCVSFRESRGWPQTGIKPGTCLHLLHCCCHCPADSVCVCIGNNKNVSNTYTWTHTL